MKSLLVLNMVQVMNVYANSFHTIIGPDGRPIIVQKNEPQASTEKILTKPSSIALAVKKDVADDQRIINSKKNYEKALVGDKKNSLLLTQSKSAKRVKDSDNNQIENVKAEKKKEKILKNKTEDFSQVITLEEKNLKVESVQNQGNVSDEYLLENNGEKFIKNEILESKEFNLEGKKRFYTLPEGIIDIKNKTTSSQTIEREKGIGQTVLKTIFGIEGKKDQSPIVLASTYYRVSQQDVVQRIGKQCFQDKKLEKAKQLNTADYVNLWPRAPLKEEFDYEVVKIGQSLQNIQIKSYASKQNSPTFYWPFAVFLDKEGCILEGAGGFKNNENDSDKFTFENLEGILNVPNKAQYLLLTPLASAIDVEGRILSNQGQLKLIGIR